MVKIVGVKQMNEERNRIMSAVVKNLEQVYDPEMPSISVIHLGLIYDIEILEDNTVVKITHTLTSAFCPMADEINQDIQKAGMVDGIKECLKKLKWPWDGIDGRRNLF